MQAMKANFVACAICTDDFPPPSVVRLPCGDAYCIDCVRAHFRTASRDEFVFPPRCCGQEIPIGHVQRFLTAHELSAYQRAGQEFNSTSRTYCATPRCGAFIPTNEISDGHVHCTECDASTCTACSRLQHDSECAANNEVEELMELSRTKHWRQCPHCRTMVGRSNGCNHMTCVCGFNFCYSCGAEQGACDCGYGFGDRIMDEPIVQHPDPRDVPIIGDAVAAGNDDVQDDFEVNEEAPRGDALGAPANARLRTMETIPDEPILPAPEDTVARAEHSVATPPGDIMASIRDIRGETSEAGSRPDTDVSAPNHSSHLRQPTASTNLAHAGVDGDVSIGSRPVNNAESALQVAPAVPDTQGVPSAMLPPHGGGLFGGGLFDTSRTRPIGPAFNFDDRLRQQLENRVAELHDTIRVLTEGNDRLAARNVELNREISGITSRGLNLALLNLTLDTEVQDLNGQIALLTDQNNTLQTQLREQAEAQLSRDQLSTTHLEHNQTTTGLISNHTTALTAQELPRQQSDVERDKSPNETHRALHVRIHHLEQQLQRQRASLSEEDEQLSATHTQMLEQNDTKHHDEAGRSEGRVSHQLQGLVDERHTRAKIEVEAIKDHSETEELMEAKLELKRLESEVKVQDRVRVCLKITLLLTWLLLLVFLAFSVVPSFVDRPNYARKDVGWQVTTTPMLRTVTATKTVTKTEVTEYRYTYDYPWLRKPQSTHTG